MNPPVAQVVGRFSSIASLSDQGFENIKPFLNNRGGLQNLRLWSCASIWRSFEGVYKLSCPEVLLRVKQYSRAVDMWSSSCAMAEFLAKEPLLPRKSPIHEKDMIFKTLRIPIEKILALF
uniref:Protein kinase domain-containing protein n=1 Tax=Physcomitrium patens TaxID=3218 RepID=A0A2K1L865_PHYPA|nr:hypothetical protein PHYPA_000659 [Physcomitrium patens]